MSVQDGDTVTVLHGERQLRVRLGGIDCPEKGQPFGAEARSFTAELALGEAVRVVEEDIDRYGRIVGLVLLPDGRNLNHEILTAGLVVSEICPRRCRCPGLGIRGQEGRTWSVGRCLPGAAVGVEEGNPRALKV